MGEFKRNNLSSDILKIKALLWKCVLIRKKQYVKTVLLFGGCLIYLLLFLNQKEFKNQHYKDMMPHESEPLAFSNLTSYDNIHGIIYATIEPDKHNSNESFIDRLVKNVADKLGINDIVKCDDPNDIIKKNIKILKNDTAYFIIIFNNETGNIMNDFVYTIRENEPYRTRFSKDKPGSDAPHDYYKDFYLGFVTVQMAIDATFIEMRSGMSLTEKLMLQSFPYPPYKFMAKEKYEILLPHIIITAGMFPVFIILGELIVERKSGIRELMRIMGVKNHLIWLSHYFHHISIQLVCSIVGALLLILGQYPIIEYSNGFIVWLSIFIYLNYLVLYSFALSSFFSRTISGISFVVTIWIASFIVEDYNVVPSDNILLTYIYSLIPHLPVQWLCVVLGLYEKSEAGISFGNIFKTPPMYPLNFGLVLVFLLVNMMLSILVIYIIELVRSDFSLVTYIHEKVKKGQLKQDDSPVHENFSYFEDCPFNADIGIRIANVSKDYYHWDGFKKVALDNVSLDVYKGCITALLGHNGAGKTTLFSIITGLISPTSGKIEIEGKNMNDQRQNALDNVGLCPQTNITFPELTVRENIVFFGIAKGLDRKTAMADTKHILQRLNLMEKRNELGMSLSGGMQRRLQLAMALAGHTRILILDEPTTGLDPKSRREIWETLLELRKSYSILLTTHFMEEADALGDRIAILNAGVLKCYGTSMYLKNLICPGYKLKLLKSEEFKMNMEASGVLKGIEQSSNLITKLSETADRIEYLIEVKDSRGIKNFFHEHEQKLKETGITSMGLSLRSIEDVFLKICDIDKNFLEGAKIDVRPTETYNSGFLAKFSALLYKRILFHKYQCYFWVPQVLLLALIIFTMFHTEHDDTEAPKALEMDLSIYDNPQTVLYSMSDNFKADISPRLSNSSVGLREHINDTQFLNELHYKDITFTQKKNVYKSLMKIGKNNIKAYSTNTLTAISFRTNQYLMLYSTSMFHILPTGINLLMNVLSNLFLGPNVHIMTYDEPIDKLETEERVPQRIQWILFAFYLNLGWQVFTSILVAYPVYERITGSRDLLLMNGVSKFTYWVTNYFFDGLICVIIALVLFSFAAIVNPLQIINVSLLTPLLVSMILNIIGTLSFIYFMSFIWKDVNSAFLQYTALTVVFMIFALIRLTFTYMKETPTFALIVDHISFIPLININLILYHIFHISSMQAECMRKQNLTYGLTCCSEDICFNGISDYYKDPVFNIMNLSVLAAIGIVIFTGLIIVCERRIFGRIISVICTAIFKPKIDTIQNTSFGSTSDSRPSIKAHTVSKVYYKFGYPMKYITALNSLKWQLKQGECFGLIGMNGAGKTTAFKILTGVELPTYGYTSIFGYTFETDRMKYLKMISYCPQFDAIGEYLTGREVLTLFAKIRGVPVRFRDDLIDKYIKEFGLSKLAGVRNKYYSGGNKRTLSLAVAMIGLRPYGPCGEVLLLDEPTSGVDPLTRQLLHKKIKEANDMGISVIISSHSMTELESLCSRLGIMIGGKLKHENTTERLKQELNIGYVIMIKFRMYSVTDQGTSMDNVDQLKERMEKVFKCKILDEHKNHIQFQIEQKNMPYSRLFAKMEEVRHDFHRLIEYYNISETTLEDIFLSCVEQHENETDGLDVV